MDGPSRETDWKNRSGVVRGFMLRALVNAAKRAGADPSALPAELEAAYA